MGIADIMATSITIYPNPAQNEFYLNLQNDSYSNTIIIYDQTGKIIKKISSYQNKTPIDLSNVRNGMYICKIKTDKAVRFAKLIIEK